MPGLGASSVGAIRGELEEDIRRIEAENAEIDMLMEQVLVEIERHESRRAKVEERLSDLERQADPERPETAELRANLLTLMRRAMLFDAQRQVLEGKQRVMARFLQRLVDIDNSLASVAAAAPRPPQPPPSGRLPGQPGALPWAAENAARGGPPGFVPPGGAGPADPIRQLRSQEDLRREIVRQLHDGPAQSLANIALQTEIVERLIRRKDERGEAELESLRRMVQQALDATKEFIFEVRPMVLDDLGLVPTLRRAAIDRSRRSGIRVDFDSRGIERRLPPDLESVLFRSIDEVIGGFLALRPPSVVVRVDWSEAELLASVEGTWPRGTSGDQAGQPGVASTRPGDTPPVLLAMMEELRSEERQAQAALRALSPERVAELGQRVRALGVSLTLREEGQVLELAAPIPAPA